MLVRLDREYRALCVMRMMGNHYREFHMNRGNLIELLYLYRGDKREQSSSK